MNLRNWRHLFLAGVLALGATHASGATAQARPETSDARARLLGDARTRALVGSLETQLLEFRRLDKSRVGPARNPVIYAPGLEPTGGFDTAPPLAEARACVNPPFALDARYIAVYVQYEPYYAANTEDADEVPEDALGALLIEQHLPAKLWPDQPGVAVVVNLTESEWSLHFDDAWSHREAALEVIREDVDENSTIEDVVCRVAWEVEARLGDPELHSTGRVYRRRRQAETIEATEQRLVELEERIKTETTTALIYNDQLRAPIGNAYEKLEEARASLSNGSLRAARRQTAHAQTELEAAHSTLESLQDLRGRVDDFARELEEEGEAMALQRSHILPHGRELDEKYETCSAAADIAQQAADAGRPLDEIAVALQDARDCLQELKDLRLRTQRDFEFYAYVLPIGSVIMLVLLGAGVLALRVRRKQKLEYEVVPALGDFEQMVPVLERRVAKLRERLDGLAAQLGPEDIDTIDRAMVLTARARAKLDRARKLADEASAWNLSPLQECVASLVEGSTELTPANTRDETAIRAGLREPEMVSNDELLSRANRLTDQALAITDEACREGRGDASL